mmetsp:Transcript_9715/g.29536  ORF Transcript_9715/g.29536 Transcript_9715/m.29536 type:complete len:716 (-) Transcript_9715:1102-3249(-)|eukprot:CAMPEP_0198726092 /NCGR_PEP_ID=MMETSP1475-20131203/3258_1 /TAXON_ID= ORGANISM="Unidentified sp., Strain CCMP1999" /NCGR_SAMPLE_ID=MMETSP1475 /ASSEMBLY_ACC=CAM_ASM_001111 /LENGTH=715 /DNA_ID=CAMNT_0044487981 /DNA_START=86 /DNA_END=2233 /DNA_ORIENTATION=+
MEDFKAVMRQTGSSLGMRMLSTDSTDMTLPLMEGPVSHFAGKFKGWRKRYLLLRDGMLGWRKPNDAHLRGSINVCHVSVQKGDGPTELVIDTGSNILKIRAQNSLVRDRWVQGIESSINILKKIRYNQRDAGQEKPVPGMISMDEFSGRNEGLREQIEGHNHYLALLLCLQENIADFKRKRINDNSLQLRHLLMDCFTNDGLISGQGTDEDILRGFNDVIAYGINVMSTQRSLWLRKFESEGLITQRTSSFDRESPFLLKDIVIGPDAASSDDEFYDPPSTFNNSMELQTVVNMVETDAQKELVNDSSKAQSVDAESQKSFAKSSPSLRTRRKKLPEQAEDRVTPGFVSIMKETVGKDLSTVSLPVTLCEPLSILQRCCEDLEYMELLDRAAASSDPFERLMLAAIFSISHYSNSENRFDKPFTAYPGETFEFTMPEKGKGFKFLAESISRVPSVTACHAESLGRSWKYYYTMEVSNKFYGKTMEMVPHGVLHIEFPEWGDHVTYTLPTTVIHNIVVGKMWVDNYGDIEFLEHREGNRCFMKLQKSGWMTSLDDVGELNGFVVDSRKSVKKNFQGSWRKSISTKDESGINRVIWNRSRSPDVARTKGYNLSEFALLLNEPIPAEEMQSYAPTDVRFRPDLRAYEEGRIAEAARLKSQLEASARSKLEESGPGGVPKWFRQTVDPNTKQKCYLSTDEYWECKETACWDKCQPLYEI